jgi:hypothetical protein
MFIHLTVLACLFLYLSVLVALLRAVDPVLEPGVVETLRS